MPDANGPSGQANWEKILTRALPHVDIFMPSGDELLYALDRSRFGEGDDLKGADLAPLGERLLDMGVGVVGIKLGSRGVCSAWLRPGRRSPVDSTRSTGAMWHPTHVTAPSGPASKPFAIPMTGPTVVR